MNIALLILRVLVGLLFVGHGAQKLFGVLGGHGLAGTGGFFESLGLRPGRPMALAAGISELGAGILLALGLLTPVASVALTATMVVAILTAHASQGLWAQNGGYEYNLVLIAAAIAIVGVGPGAWSLDAALGLDLSGTAWALGALLVGILGGLGAVITGRAGDRRSASAPQTTPA